MTMLSINLSNIVIITVKNVDYRCIIHDKYKAIKILESTALEDRAYI